jgi:hypothetical protein
MAMPEAPGAAQGATPMIAFQAAVRLTSPTTTVSQAGMGMPRPRVDAGFASHRNATAVALMRTLADTFPTVVRMLGEDAFIEVATQFVAQEAPTTPAAAFYGDRFPAFMRRVDISASAGYIADIAAIDAAVISSQQMADAAAVPYVGCGNPFGDLSAHLALHHSVVLLQSKFPAVTGWQVNQPRGNRWLRRWGPEDALVACTRLDAQVWRLPDGGFGFLTALIGGASLADAAAAGLRASSSFDLAEMSAVLSTSNVITAAQTASTKALRQPASPRPSPSTAG